MDCNEQSYGRYFRKLIYGAFENSFERFLQNSELRELDFMQLS